MTKVNRYSTVAELPDVPHQDGARLLERQLSDQAVYLIPASKTIGFELGEKLFFVSHQGGDKFHVARWVPENKGKGVDKEYAVVTDPSSEIIAKFKAYAKELDEIGIAGYALGATEGVTDQLSGAGEPTGPARAREERSGPAVSLPADVAKQIQEQTALMTEMKAKLEAQQAQLAAVVEENKALKAAQEKTAGDLKKLGETQAETKKAEETKKAKEAAEAREAARTPSYWGILKEILEVFSRIFMPIVNLISALVRVLRMVWTVVEEMDRLSKVKGEDGKPKYGFFERMAKGIAKIEWEEWARLGGDLVGGLVPGMGWVGAAVNEGANLFWPRDDAQGLRGGSHQLLGGINQWTTRKTVKNAQGQEVSVPAVREFNPIRELANDVLGVGKKIIGSDSPKEGPRPEATAPKTETPVTATAPRVVGNGTGVTVGNTPATSTVGGDGGP